MSGNRMTAIKWWNMELSLKERELNTRLIMPSYRRQDSLTGSEIENMWDIFVGPEKQLYNKEEVLQLLVEERQRAMDIALAFYNTNQAEYESRKKAGSALKEIAYVKRECADTARKIGCAISGLTGLSSPEDTIKQLIEKKLNT